MMPSEELFGASIQRPTQIVGRVGIRPTIFAESVAISGEALLIGLLVLLVLAVLGILATAALVYLGARLAVSFRGQDAGQVDSQDVIPAVPYEPGGRRHHAPRSPRQPLAAWLWVLCTVVPVGLVVALPGIWYIGLLTAPLLGAAGAELTRLIDRRSLAEDA